MLFFKPSFKLLRFLPCLNPDRRSDASLRAIEFVASKLRTPAADIANVSDEWRLYIYDEETRKPEKATRVDHYWSDIFQLQTANGNPRYPLLTRIVKAALVLPHGNSDVERGISVNSRMLTAERNKLSEETINGLCNTKDMVKFSYETLFVCFNQLRKQIFGQGSERTMSKLSQTFNLITRKGLSLQKIETCY